MFKWSRAAVTRMNGSVTPDSSFLRPARVPYKVLYALLFTLLIVIIVLLLPTATNHPTQLIAISAVERVDREGTSSGGALTIVKDDCASFTYNTTYPLTPPRSKEPPPFLNKYLATVHSVDQKTTLLVLLLPYYDYRL